MSKVSTIDATAYHELENLYNVCEEQDTELIILNAQKHVYKVLEKYEYVERLGRENFCNNIEAAIDRTNHLLNSRKSGNVA